MGDTQSLPDDGRSPQRYTRSGLSARLSRLLGQSAIPLVVNSLRLFVVEMKTTPTSSFTICVAMDSKPPQYVILMIPTSVQPGESIALLPPWHELIVNGLPTLIGSNVECINTPDNIEDLLAEVPANNCCQQALKKEIIANTSFPEAIGASQEHREEAQKTERKVAPWLSVIV